MWTQLNSCQKSVPALSLPKYEEIDKYWLFLQYLQPSQTDFLTKHYSVSLGLLQDTKKLIH